MIKGHQTVKGQKITHFVDGLADNEIEQEDWTFAAADTRILTHGLHPYPARMIPQVAGKLIDIYKPDDDRYYCLDPYSGSGTVLVEAKLRKVKSIGIDANPLAVLLSKVKTTPIKYSVLSDVKKNLIENIKHDMVGTTVIPPPKMKNLDYWFKDHVIQELSIIRKNIFEVEDADVADFLKVCFSLAVRKSSNTRPGEFKLFRIASDKLPEWKPRPFDIFAKILENNIQRMRDFTNLVDPSVPSYALKGDSRKLFEIDSDVIQEECASLIITSPPYGDAHTTVAYGQFSRYSSAWLGFDEKEVWKVDKNALGGKVYEKMADLESRTLDEVVKKIEERDEYRAKETYAFFKDIDECFQQFGKILKRNKSTVCYVLGNRTVKRLRIPAHIIMTELASKYGFEHHKTFERDIPNKHMPLSNAPENVTDLTGETMSKENIVIWKY